MFCTWLVIIPAVIAGKHNILDWTIDIDSNCATSIFHKERGLVLRSQNLFLQVGRTQIEWRKVIENGDLQFYPRPIEYSDKISCDQQVNHGQYLSVFGTASFFNLSVTYSLIWSQNNQSNMALDFSVDIKGSDGDVKFLALNYESASNEEFYGMGLQYTLWNFKGEKVHVITSEGGVGRGLEPITYWLNYFRKNQGGNTLTTYAPSFSYISNKNYGLLVQNSQISHADFTKENLTQLLFWHVSNLQGSIVVGDTPKRLISQITKIIGRMRPLPDWILQGVVVGLQGGQEVVERNYAMLKQNGVPIVAVWMQDWVGTKEFPEGVRLLWNWKLNKKQYPNWNSMVQKWKLDNVRPMVYINPYFANVTDPAIERNLFQEGHQNGYFVKNLNGETYLIQSISIQFAMVDLTNPDAVQWLQNIIYENLILEGQAYGWMHDFGEYTPFDISLFSGMDPVEYHNQYPFLWAKLNQELYSKVSYGNQIVAFMRAGSTLSPKYTDLFWMGDQLTSLDEFDGLQSALIGMLNGGISGFSQCHSDIGGYTYAKFFDIEIKRTKEVMLRWIEMNAFSDIVMRSHPSNKPKECHQIYDDTETAKFLAKFALIHQKLGPYKKQLVNEAVDEGTPITRSLLIEYPQDSISRTIKDQFMLGSELLMAPIFALNTTQRAVYLPPGQWVKMWTGEEFDVKTGQKFQSDAPIGKPIVFVKKGSLPYELLKEYFSNVQIIS